MAKQDAVAVRPEQASASVQDAPDYMANLMNGDLSQLTPDQQLAYYLDRCNRIGLDPMSQPFLFMKTKGRDDEKPKTILYATRSATDQIGKRDGLSGTIVSKELLGGVAVVVVRITGGGRSIENIGAASYKYDNQAGDALKRAITQGYRRGIVQFSGLGIVSEDDIADIAGAQVLGMHEVRLTESEAPKRLNVGTAITDTATGEVSRPASPEQLALLRRAAEYLYNEFDEHCPSDSECAAYTYEQADAEIQRRRQRAARLKRGREAQAAKQADPVVAQHSDDQLDVAFPEVPMHVGTP